MREVLLNEPHAIEVDDGEYEVYLFWPSLRRSESAFAANEHSIYGVCLRLYLYAYAA